MLAYTYPVGDHPTEPAAAAPHREHAVVSCALRGYWTRPAADGAPAYRHRLGLHAADPHTWWRLRPLPPNPNGRFDLAVADEPWYPLPADGCDRLANSRSARPQFLEGAMSFHTETTLAGYARTAVSLKTRMDAYCRSSGGRHYLTTFADAFHDNAYPGQAPTPDLIDAVHRLAGSAWRIGEPYVLAPAMTAIVAAAAADALDLAGETLHDEVAPGDFGVAVPARPELRPQPPRTPHRHRRDHLGPAVGAQRQRVGDRRLVRARRPPTTRRPPGSTPPRAASRKCAAS